MAGEGIIVSTSYLPPIGYVSALLKASEIVIELDETYPKQTCRNHACIYSPNGKQTLSIPVHKPGGNHTKTRDIRISYALPWNKTHWRAIEAAYNNSPFFIYYQDYFIPFYEKEYEFLADLNSEILETVFRILRISRPLRFNETYVSNPEGLRDLRQELTEKHARAVCPVYTQTFAEKHGFIPNLSIIDLLFNLGPETPEYLQSIL
jgi:hypothetical protein